MTETEKMDEAEATNKGIEGSGDFDILPPSAIPQSAGEEIKIDKELGLGLVQDSTTKRFEFDPVKLMNANRKLGIQAKQDYAKQMHSIAQDLAEAGITDRTIEGKHVIFVTKPELSKAGKPKAGTYTGVADYIIQRKLVDLDDKNKYYQVRRSLASKVSLRGDKDTIVGKEANLGKKKAIVTYVDSKTIEDIIDVDTYANNIELGSKDLDEETRRKIKKTFKALFKNQVSTPSRSQQSSRQTTPVPSPSIAESIDAYRSKNKGGGAINTPSVASIQEDYGPPVIVTPLKAKRKQRQKA